jgi:hypothetical protein
VKLLAGAIVLTACTLSACSLSFDTVGTWSNEKPPPSSLLGASSVVLPDGEIVFVGGYDLRTGQPLNGVLRFDPKDNSWSQGAPLPFQQTGYTTVALSNGSVLVAGGGSALPVVAPGGGAPQGGNGLLATSWLYSPPQNSWRRVGNLQVARSDAAAVLLTSGQVLIVGGSVPLATPIQLPDGGTDFFGFSTSAEMFDPQTNSWSLAGSMNVARGAIALLALPNGMALAAGGCASANQGSIQGGAVDTTELFDSVRRAWTVTTPLPEPRCGASALLLPDGRGLVTGGFYPQVGSVDHVDLYDEQKHSWTAAGSTVAGASAPVLLADGQVLFAATQAGQINGRVEALVVGGQLFDPASGDWNFVTSNSVLVVFQGQPEDSPTVVARSDGTAVVFLRTFDTSFTFNPSGAPPPVGILDSSGLALVLAALAAGLCLWLAIHYVQGRMHGGR